MKKLLCFITAFLSFNALSQCFSTGTGVDGAYLATANTTLAGGSYNFTSFTINPGVVVSVTGTTSLTIYCTGTATIDGILRASGGNGGNGITYSNAGIGGIGVAGGGNGGSGSFASGSGPLNATNGNNTGGAGTFGSGWSGGGGAGYASNGNATGGAGGFAGPSYGTADIAGLWAGSGGGGGSGGFDCGAGGGGAGGGLIIINANSLIIGAAGSIQSNGGNGGTDGTGNCGGGGAGSGGSIWISAPSITNNGSISAVGGIGGASAVPGSPYYGTGANGSNGRIRVDGSINGSGSVTPIVGYSETVLSAVEDVIISSCEGASNGSASVVATGGTGPYSYSWSNGFIGNPANGLSPMPYTCLITDQSGCTFNVQLVVPSIAATSFTQTLELCDGESITVGSSTYSSSGNYQDIIPNTAGCDSTITTNLTVLPAISSSQTLNICAGETVTVGTETYSMSGTYQTIFSSITGCDSTVTTDLSVALPLNTTVTINQSVLQVAQVSAVYQWIDCNNGNSPISMATNQSFSPTLNGDYAVIVSLGGCADTSICENYNLVGITEIPLSHLILYPNPTSGKCFVELNGDVCKSLTVTDASGRHIEALIFFSQNLIEIDLSDEIGGLYFINLQTESGIQLLKVSKQ